MSINRNNYEEYFLLYADNELTDSEKAEVLIFVKNNKDLEQEFRMMLHTIAKPDLNIQLNDKSFLRKKDASFINKFNYEEIFVLYHDNELTGEQKSQTEFFLSQHPELNEEFDLIGLARFTPDPSAVFHDKKSLYREENAGKIIPLFWKVAAAAVLIGFILWPVSLYFEKTNQSLVNSNQGPTKTSLPEARRNTVPSNPNANQKLNEATVHNSGKEVNPNKVKRVNVVTKKKDNNIVIKNAFKEEDESGEVAINMLPGKIDSKISGNELRNHSEVSSINTIIPVVPIKNITDKNPGDNVSAIAITKADNDNYVFYDVKADNFKKSKVAGFLKKVKRVVERTNPIAQLLSGDGHQLASK